jgi:uncharacterized membrane protein
MPCLSGQQYYADITIDVDSSGFVTIEGSTNHPDLLIKDTEQYTSKKQSYWLLNITKDDIFSEYVFVVSFPEDSSINFIGSDGSIRIEEEQGDLLVKGFGENKSFSVIVQYQIEKVEDSTDTNEVNQITNILLLIIIFVSIITLVFLHYSKFFKKPDEKFEDFKNYNLKGLSERQKKIMQLLIERKRPLTQTEIQKELKIPKAAVSRNIRTLERKGLIEKEQIGMSNLITLKKQ